MTFSVVMVVDRKLMWCMALVVTVLGLLAVIMRDGFALLLKSGLCSIWLVRGLLSCVVYIVLLLLGVSASWWPVLKVAESSVIGVLRVLLRCVVRVLLTWSALSRRVMMVLLSIIGVMVVRLKFLLLVSSLALIWFRWMSLCMVGRRVRLVWCSSCVLAVISGWLAVLRTVSSVNLHRLMCLASRLLSDLVLRTFLVLMSVLIQVVKGVLLVTCLMCCLSLLCSLCLMSRPIEWVCLVRLVCDEVVTCLVLI